MKLDINKGKKVTKPDFSEKKSSFSDFGTFWLKIAKKTYLKIIKGNWVIGSLSFCRKNVYN